MPATEATQELDRRQILSALRAFRRGDFSVRLPEDLDGIDGDIAQTFNEIVDLNGQLTSEFERLGRRPGGGALRGRKTLRKPAENLSFTPR